MGNTINLDELSSSILVSEEGMKRSSALFLKLLIAHVVDLGLNSVTLMAKAGELEVYHCLHGHVRQSITTSGDNKQYLFAEIRKRSGFQVEKGRPGDKREFEIKLIGGVKILVQVIVLSEQAGQEGFELQLSRLI